MQLIDPKYTDFERIRKEFEWNIPRRFNMAWQVCDKHRSLKEKPALYFEQRNGELKLKGISKKLRIQ